MHDKDKYLIKQKQKKTAIIIAAHRRAKAAARIQHFNPHAREGSDNQNRQDAQKK